MDGDKAFVREDGNANKLETEVEKKERYRSIYIIYFTMFLMSLGFSIILTGVWPYLNKLDPTAGKEFMGFIVAANPLAQMVFSPLVGWWSNRLKNIHAPLLASIGIFTLASGWYSLLEIFPSYHKYWMLFTRFLVGMSSANIAVCRSYLSAATLLEERTKAVSMVSLAQVLGFIVGPGLQALVTILGDEGYMIGGLRLNMYTASGWINVFLGLINFILFLPFVFIERKIAAKEAMLLQNAESEKATWKGKKPDYLAVWTLIVAFFVLVFNFVLLETLGSPLTMDQFGWTKKEAMYYMGIMMFVGGIIACCTFAIIGPLCRWFAENTVMVWGGFFFMFLGRVVTIPWGSELPPIAVPFNETGLNSSLSDYTPLGCPISQTWCQYTPAIGISQFILGYALTAMGYPVGVTLIQTIFSKLLGPRPQGTWMGWLTGAGCLSRVLGPIFISFIYTELGTIWTFVTTALMMALAQGWLMRMRGRLEKAVLQHTQQDILLTPTETKPPDNTENYQDMPA